MRILMTGASGLVGSALCPLLAAGGNEVVRLVRSRPANKFEVQWDPEAGTMDLRAIEGFDALVHLAGENIAAGRWTEARKKNILESRKRGTALLAESLVRLERPPKTFVSASAIGYYGSRGAQVLSEESSSGEGFLAEVCRKWEEATMPASARGVRVVRLRVGIVLSTRGGALAKMLLPFKVGLGGRIGSGSQYMSWISLADLCAVFQHALVTASLQGSVNAVAPSPVTNIEFTRELASVLGRPAIIPLPGFAAHILLGEMADELLLASTRVSSAKLEASGFVFRHRDLGTTLKIILNEKI